jgi:hypothetical protein
LFTNFQKALANVAASMNQTNSPFRYFPEPVIIQLSEFRIAQALNEHFGKQDQSQIPGYLVVNMTAKPSQGDAIICGVSVSHYNTTIQPTTPVEIISM